MPLENQGGTFYHLSFFRGAFFGSKIALERSKKKSGGLAPYVWKFRGAYFYNLSWSEKAPLNSQRFLLRNFRCAGIAGLNPCQHVIIFVNFWQSLNLIFCHISNILQVSGPTYWRTIYRRYPLANKQMTICENIPGSAVVAHWRFATRTASIDIVLSMWFQMPPCVNSWILSVTF